MGKLDIKLIQSVSGLEQKVWNELVKSAYPFLRWEFLRALEESGAVSEKTGWQPQHVLVFSEGELIALMPMYLKSHSRGEYVFDHSWADAYARHGLRYYPKLLSAVPFTPCEGPRLVIKEEYELEEKQRIFSGVVELFSRLADEFGISSWHCLFPEPESLKLYEKEDGVLKREAVQFQWFNKSYKSFDDFLAALTSKRRKNLKRERRRVEEQGIKISRLRTEDISSHHWQVFFDFYRATYWKRGMPEYLSLDFFTKLAELMPESLLMIVAEKEGELVAAALSLIGEDTLFGRYWGCLEDFDNLHFELCYYQGIEFCIEQGLKCFNSGAQGEHKIARGFEPVITYSLHWIAHSGFREAIADFLQEENTYMGRYKNAAGELLPFNIHNKPESE
jgi:predicted N-acyltransferase